MLAATEHKDKTQKQTKDDKDVYKQPMTRENLHAARQKMVEQKKHGKKVVHDTEAMIKELGYDLDVVVATEPKTVTVRDQLYEAIAAGSIKTTADVQQWMALHAPMTAMPGVNHDLITQMTADAQANAERAVSRLVAK